VQFRLYTSSLPARSNHWGRNQQVYMELFFCVWHRRHSQRKSRKENIFKTSSSFPDDFGI